MISSLTGLLRGIAILGFLVAATAIGLGKFAPQPARFHLKKEGNLVEITRHLSPKVTQSPRFFDPETGKVVPVGIPAEDVLDCAARSPWLDEMGQSQVVGRWIRRDPESGLNLDYGLARYTFPSGKTLNHVSMDLIPVSRPCFFPGDSRRILFAAGDGGLYRVHFGDGHEPREPGDSGDDELTPVPLAWRVKKPGERVLLSDPVWPTASKLDGKLIVSLAYNQKIEGKNVFTHSRLWWLQLSPDAKEIVDAGPLTDLETTPASIRFDHRLANFGTMPDGSLTLAYLERRPRSVGWALCVAPVKIDEATGAISVVQADSRTVAVGCEYTLPVFSPDGRWVFGVDASQHERVRRFSVADAMNGVSSSQDGLALVDDDTPPLQ